MRESGLNKGEYGYVLYDAKQYLRLIYAQINTIESTSTKLRNMKKGIGV